MGCEAGAGGVEKEGGRDFELDLEADAERHKPGAGQGVRAMHALSLKPTPRH